MKKHLLFFVLGIAALSGIAASRSGYRQSPAIVSGGVTESMFTFGDVTTADANTSRHGLLPKLPTLALAGRGYFSPGGWVTAQNSIIGNLLISTNESGYSAADGNILIQDGATGGFYILFLGAPGTVLRSGTGGMPEWAAIAENSLSLSDNATNDVSASQHGFMPKNNGNANTFYNGNGGQTAVSEAGLSLSDNATANANTSRHGFLPKLSGDSGDVLNGLGQFVPASGGGGGAGVTYIIHDELIDLDTIDENLAYGLNVTVAGAEVGDAVIVVADRTEGVLFSGYVTAPDTVQLQIWNPTPDPINPASQTFRFYVFDADASASTGLSSGTYTPTLTAAGIVTATTAHTCFWTRIGDIVTVSGVYEFTTSSSGVATVDISLPVASNFTNSDQLAGSGTPSTAGSADAQANTTDDRATLSGQVASATSYRYTFNFSYRVL